MPISVGAGLRGGSDDSFECNGSLAGRLSFPGRGLRRQRAVPSGIARFRLRAPRSLRGPVHGVVVSVVHKEQMHRASHGGLGIDLAR